MPRGAGQTSRSRPGGCRVNGHPRGIAPNTFVEGGRRRSTSTARLLVPQQSPRVRPAQQARRVAHHRARPARAADRGRARPARGARPSGRAARRGHDRGPPAHERRRARAPARPPPVRGRQGLRGRGRRQTVGRSACRACRGCRPRRRPHCARPARALSAPHWSSSTIHEGRKHQVKRMLEAVGHPVPPPPPQPLRGPDRRGVRARHVARAHRATRSPAC